MEQGGGGRYTSLLKTPRSRCTHTLLRPVERSVGDYCELLPDNEAEANGFMCGGGDDSDMMP